MIEWLITGKNLSYLRVAFGIATLVCMSALIFYKDEYRKSIKITLLSIASVGMFCGISAIGLFIFDRTMVEKSVAYSDWKQVDSSTSENSEYLAELTKSIVKLKDRPHIDLFLQTKQDGSSDLQNFRLNISDIISDHEINENSKIVKIEYRDVDHIDTSAFGHQSRIDRSDISSKIKGQMRVTFESK